MVGEVAPDIIRGDDRARVVPQERRGKTRSTFYIGKPCHYCDGGIATSRDHIVPKALGGLTREWNLVPACTRCNNKKSHKFPWCVCGKCCEARRRWEAGDRNWLTKPADEVSIVTEITIIVEG